MKKRGNPTEGKKKNNPPEPKKVRKEQRGERKNNNSWDREKSSFRVSAEGPGHQLGPKKKPVKNRQKRADGAKKKGYGRLERTPLAEEKHHGET